jgi:hypothetical protein
VIRGRSFDTAYKFLPDGFSLADAFATLSADEKRYVSQIQGRTYANIFGLVERFINAKVLELSEDHWFGDQVALEALVRFSDEDLKHQALFRLVDAMVGDVLPAGYRFDVDHNAVAHAVLEKAPGRCSRWMASLSSIGWRSRTTANCAAFCFYALCWFLDATTRGLRIVARGRNSTSDNHCAINGSVGATWRESNSCEQKYRG